MRKTYFILGLIGAGMLAINACRQNQLFPDSELDARMSGGDDYTIFDASSNAFSTMLPGMNARDRFVHEIGDKFFEAPFVSAPAPVNPGLGPIFNNTSCSGCHQRDGRGRPPMPGESFRAMLFRVSIPGKASNGGPRPVPGFGTQLQDKAIASVTPEAEISLTYTGKTETLDDGTTVTLHVPHYTFSDPYRPLPTDLLFSPRIASQPLGVGLIEAIPDEAIRSHADPEDANQDGVSGRVNHVYNVITNKMSVGRFGWKANVPDVLGQVASAFHDDMGITNYIFPEESSKGQPQYPDHPITKPDIPDSVLHAVTFYMRTLAVPARRNVNKAEIKQGAVLFRQTGCTSCHITTFTTRVDVAFPALSNQVIHPYSDFLLHDMGPALADGRPDYEATGSEWRTAPLWGIGLTEKISGYTYYLHDGRARSLMEAILWHGGEGTKSKNAFKALSKTDRNALLSFLKSL